MKQAYRNHNFNKATLDRLVYVNGVLLEYAKQGYTLTIRQLYYQLVSRDLISNNVKEYKKLVSLMTNAREAGLVDWDMIEDRNRETQRVSTWSDPAQILDNAALSYRLDPWINQEWHVEVMVEKDALSGVLWRPCSQLRVRLTANKGYSSATMMREIGLRIRKAQREGRDVKVIYLGDHDPSGIDMTRDITDRLEMFAQTNYIKVARLALNYNQVEEWKPPENPAKQTDSRFEEYAREFGTSSWELDAVEPGTLADLVKDEIESIIDWSQWDRDIELEEKQKARLKQLAREWSDET